MKKPFFALFLFAALLSGCSTNPYQGVSDNAFPRHKLNFLFKESFSLDYSSLKASDWKLLHQSVKGAFAKTEIIPKNEEAGNWQQKITLVYYPSVTVPGVSSSFDGALNYAKNQLTKECVLNSADIQWKNLEESENRVLGFVKWANCGQEGVSLLEKTPSGLNEVTWIKKGVLSEVEISKFSNIIKSAKIIEYQG